MGWLNSKRLIQISLNQILLEFIVGQSEICLPMPVKTWFGKGNNVIISEDYIYFKNWQGAASYFYLQ